MPLQYHIAFASSIILVQIVLELEQFALSLYMFRGFKMHICANGRIGKVGWGRAASVKHSAYEIEPTRTKEVYALYDLSSVEPGLYLVSTGGIIEVV